MEYPKASHKQRPTRTVEDIQDVDSDARPQGNNPPKNPHHVLEPSNEEATPPPPSHKKATGPKKNSPMAIDSSDDDDDNPRPRPEKSKGRKKSKNSPMVIDSSSDDQVNKKGMLNKKVLPVISENAMVRKKPNKTVLAASPDSDTEEIQDTKESPEEELGELYLI